MMFLWSALLLGLGGSLHCVGKCGPIALALPLTRQERLGIALQSLSYHLGRILTYASLGFIFGWLGWGLALAGWQKAFSIILGAGLLISALFSFFPQHHLWNNRLFHSFLTPLRARLSRVFASTHRFAAFQIGLLNGFLPCGLVYVALAAAVATGDYWLGAVYMATFGLGTIPLLLALMMAGQSSKGFFRRLQPLKSIALALFGLLLLYRGLALPLPTELLFWESTHFPLMCF